MREPTIHFAPEFAVAAQPREGNLIQTLGAGNVSKLAPQILAALKAA